MHLVESSVKLTDKEKEDYIKKKRTQSDIITSIARKHYPFEAYGFSKGRIQISNEDYYVIWQHWDSCD